ENMAESVWTTLEKFGLEKRVMGFMMDNASNNDTLIEAIELKCIAADIKFSAKRSRLRCMPHTIHLAVMILLKAIGAVDDESRGKKAQPYQESVTSSPASDADDEDAVKFDGDEDMTTTQTAPQGIKAAIWKLRKIIRSVRSSPQRRQRWYYMLQPDHVMQCVHMLILDVKT
ncbi:hypothetical protein GGX14DRAFT_333423, partial [Mycena pura]